MQLLQELGAVDERNELTRIGQKLAQAAARSARGPHDAGGARQHCLAEMLIIAAALSVQDPRDRPMEAQEAADQAHEDIADEKTEFLTLVKIWNSFRRSDRATRNPTAS